MKLSPEEIAEELTSLAGILRLLRRRRADLQRKAALRGSSADPSIPIEIEDITAQMQTHEEEIRRLETQAAEGDQSFAEVEYRVQVADAWNTPEGRPTVAGAARLELARLRLGVSPDRAAAIEHEVRTALVQEVFTALDGRVLLGTTQPDISPSLSGHMSVVISPYEGGTVVIENLSMSQIVTQDERFTVMLRLVGRAVRLDVATAVPLFILCLAPQSAFSVATFGPLLLTANQVALHTDERPLFERFIDELAKALGQPVADDDQAYGD